MFEDGTWKREIGKKDQIITLTTKKLSEMQSKFDQQVASFATQIKKEITPISTSNQDRESRRPKRAPYKVAAWRLVKKEDNIIVNGRDFHWCTGDHYSGGVKHNRMYANYKSSDHNAGAIALTTQKQIRNLGKHPMKVLVLQQHQYQLKNLHSMTNFEMHFVPKQVFLLKLLIVSGKVPKETSRSESRVE